MHRGRQEVIVIEELILTNLTFHGVLANQHCNDRRERYVVLLALLVMGKLRLSE